MRFYLNRNKFNNINNNTNNSFLITVMDTHTKH